MIVKIPRANIHALSSDLLEGKVKLVFQMPLNAETMGLREKIAMLKILDTPVEVAITSPQAMLGMSTLPAEPTAEKVADALLDDLAAESFLEGQAEFESGVRALGKADTVTLSTKNKSVTVSGKQFAKAARNGKKKK